MALTKLNARSASALDATILTGNLPAISGASLTGVGISVADTWRISASFTGTASPIASNWVQQNTAGMGTIGSGMTQSSGIFSFPSTGVYAITYYAYINGAVESRYNSIQIYATINNSAYTHMAENSQFIQETSGSVAYSSVVCQTYFDVTDTSQCKIRFHFVPANANVEALGSNYSATNVSFIRLGDT